MPPIQDPALLAEIERQQRERGMTLAGPGPMSAPSPMGGAPMINPGRLAAQNQADARLNLSEQANARTAANEARRLELAAQENDRQERAAARVDKKAEATGGVDTTEAENTAAFLTTQLTGHVKRINEINEKFPEAMKPGWTEWLGGFLGPRGKALSTDEKVLDARNQLNNRYGLAADVLLTLGTGAAYTAEQKKTYVEAYAPQVTDTPAVLADKKRMMREALVAARTKSGAAVGQIDRAALMLDQLYGGEPGLETETEISTDKQVMEIPKGYQEEHRAFVVQNMGKLTVDDYLNFRKSMDQKYTDDPNDPNTYTTNYSQEDAQKFVDTVNAGLGASQEIAPSERELSEGEKLDAKVAASPAAMAFVSTANAATGGLVDGIANAQGKGDKLDMMRENSPISNLAGEVAGSVAPMKALQVGATKGIEKIASQLTPAARKRFLADTSANAAYGGIRGGMGTDEDENFLVETAKGAGVGAGASAAVSTVTRGLTPLASREFQNAKELAPAGTIERFNRDNANRALRYIGKRVPKSVKPGTEMTDTVHRELSNAYEVIKPNIGGAADGTFDNAITALKAQAKTPEKKAMFAEVADAVKLFKDSNGMYTGQGYKNASERLRYLAKTWATKGATQGDVAADDMARVAEQARKNMQTLIMRQTPEVGQELKQVERGWAHLIRIEDAGGRALKGDGPYTPGNYIDGIKKFDTSARKNASARGKAFDQKYAMASEKVIGSKGVPQVSMGDRLRFATIMGAAGSAGATDPKTAAIVAALSYGLYGPRAKQITKSIFLGKRPSKVDNEYLHNVMADALRHETTGD